MLHRCLAGLLLATAATSADAGGWAQKKGKGQVIVKTEVMRASKGYDPTGAVRPLPGLRHERLVGVFAEYGLTDRLTVQFKADWQEGEDAFVDYAGGGPAEIGLTWQVYRDNRNALSLYGGYAVSGSGRNAGYALPGFRIGRSGSRPAGPWATPAPVGPAVGGLIGPSSRFRRPAGFATACPTRFAPTSPPAPISARTGWSWARPSAA